MRRMAEVAADGDSVKLSVLLNTAVPGGEGPAPQKDKELETVLKPKQFDTQTT